MPSSAPYLGGRAPLDATVTTSSTLPLKTSTLGVAPPGGATAGVDVRGGAPGTRETDLLDPRNSVQRAHAIMLGGGSAYGLLAAHGVLTRLAALGRGVPVGDAPSLVVPIVPAAILF